MHKTNETNEFVEILQKLPGEVKKETDATAISGKLNKITSSRDRARMIVIMLMALLTI